MSDERTALEDALRLRARAHGRLVHIARLAEDAPQGHGHVRHAADPGLDGLTRPGGRLHEHVRRRRDLVGVATGLVRALDRVARGLADPGERPLVLLEPLRCRLGELALLGRALVQRRRGRADVQARPVDTPGDGAHPLHHIEHRPAERHERVGELADLVVGGRVEPHVERAEIAIGDATRDKRESRDWTDDATIETKAEADRRQERDETEEPAAPGLHAQQDGGDVRLRQLDEERALGSGGGCGPRAIKVLGTADERRPQGHVVALDVDDDRLSWPGLERSPHALGGEDRADLFVVVRGDDATGGIDDADAL